MNKAIWFFVSRGVWFFVGGGVVFLLVLVLQPPQVVAPVGVSFDEPSFSSVTSAQISCPNVLNGVAATTSVLVAGNRNSFIVQNVDEQGRVVSLCRAANLCTATSGIMLHASTTAQAKYEQVDNYSGAYICRGASVTSTINVNYNQ